MSFYVTLPSNASMDVYPDNTLTEYRVNLPSPIQLEGSHEVALAEIQYPRTWSNLEVHEARVKLHIKYKKNLSSMIEFPIPPEFYETTEDLVETLNDYLEEEIKRLIHKKSAVSQYLIMIGGKTDGTNVLKLHHMKLRNMVYAESKPGIRLQLSPAIRGMLGFSLTYIGSKFPYETPENDVGVCEMVKTFCTQKGDPYRGQYALYLYSNLVEAQVVGDTMAPLLRVVPIEGKHGEVITKTYTHLHYVPVTQSFVNNVEIYIRNDVGKKMPFERGKVVVTLHFRRRSQF